MTSCTHIKTGKTKILSLLFLPHLELGSFFSVSCLYSSSSAWLGRTSHEGWLCYFLYRLWHLTKDMFLFTVTHTWLQGDSHFIYLFFFLKICTFLKQIQAGLSALEEALQSGFEDFKVMNQWYRNTMLLRLYNLKVCLKLLLLWNRESEQIQTWPILEHPRSSTLFWKGLMNHLSMKMPSMPLSLYLAYSTRNRALNEWVQIKGSQALSMACEFMTKPPMQGLAYPCFKHQFLICEFVHIISFGWLLTGNVIFFFFSILFLCMDTEWNSMRMKFVYINVYGYSFI